MLRIQADSRSQRRVMAALAVLMAYAAAAMTVPDTGELCQW